MGRSTKVEKNFRVDTVYKLLSEGNSRGQIQQFAATQWNVSERQIDQYIADARELLKADWDIDRRTFTAELMSQLASLQKECRKNNMSAVALGCINTMAKIAHILEK